MGAVGGLAAALVAGHFDWKTGYLVGGCAGFVLLGARLGMIESPLYAALATTAPGHGHALKRGDLLQLVSPPARLFKFVGCVLMGLPIWYVAGILITFSPELCAALGVPQAVPVSEALFYTQLGAIAGDFSSGTVSQLIRSRKKVLLGFLAGSALVCAVYLGSLSGLTLERVRLVYVALGFTNGYWPVLFTAVAESFGTNLRSTVTISVPNLIRGSLILLVLGLQFLRPAVGLVNATIIVGLVSFGAAFLGLAALRESYGKDLRYLER
jgi:hypothetical protein